MTELFVSLRPLGAVRGYWAYRATPRARVVYPVSFLRRPMPFAIHIGRQQIETGPSKAAGTGTCNHRFSH